MRQETRARLKRLLGGWTREIRHPDRNAAGDMLMHDPNHPIR